MKTKLLLMLLVMSSGLAFGQVPTYQLVLQNDSLIGSTVYEFDIVLMRTGSTTFELASLQPILTFNTSISSGSLTFTINSGSSQLNPLQQPPNGRLSISGNELRIAPNVPPGSGSGTIIPVSPGLRVGRFRVTSSVPFADASANIAWKELGTDPITKVNAYVGGLNTPVTAPGSQLSTLANGSLSPLTITSSSPLPAATSRIAYTDTLTAANGTPPYTWALQSGSLPSGITLSAAGVISGTSTIVGTYNFFAQVTDNAATIVSKAFSLTVTPGAATQLTYLQQPTDATAGAAISPAVTVQLRDVDANIVPTAGVSVGVSLLSGTGTLSGTLSRLTDGSGTATFNDLSINRTGAKTLGASSTGLSPATSSSFTISPGLPAALVFVQQPSDGPAGAVIAPAVTVQLQDASGNNTPAIGLRDTMSLVSGSGALTGTLVRTTDATGLATFNDLSINQAGAKQFRAGGAGVTSATSRIFTLSAFTITATADAGGSISPSGSVSVNSGANQAFTFTPNTGYHVDSVIVDGVNQGSIPNYTFTNVTANHTIRASFAINTFTITPSANPGGTISPSSPVTVNYGASQGFTFTPNTGYHVDSVFVDGVNQGSLPSYTFTNVTANHTIRASFAINAFTIAASAGSGGTISPSGPVNVSYGANQQFTLTPNAGYHIDSLVVDGVAQPLAASYTFTNVTSNHTIRAAFAITTFTITASADAGGTISPSGPVTVNYGASKGFTFTPNSGYHVDSVFVDGVNLGSIPGYTFTNVTADHSIRASFAINQFTITASSGPNGTISPSGPVGVSSGSNQLFTLSPNSGYRVDSLIVDGVSQTPATSYTFTNVTANHTIRAVFALNVYTIAASAGSGGTISPSGNVAVNYGANQPFTLSPSTGYHIDSLIVDGVSQTPAASYTFTNVTSNHTIRAIFAINTFTITATAGLNGSISPSGAVIVNYGANQGFTITPSGGYHIDSVFVDGVNQGAIPSYTFTNVTADHSIRAAFAINQYTITPSSGPNGSISPSSPVGATSGSSATFTMTANTGYHIANVLVDGTSVGAPPSFTFNNIAANHTISVTFTPNQLSITVQTAPQGLSIIVDGNRYTSPQTFTWTAATGHTIGTDSIQNATASSRLVWASWSDSGARSHAVSPLVNTTYTANFGTQYYLTMSANAGGSVTPASNWFNSGQNVTITAQATSAYSFSSWSGSGSGSYSGFANPSQVTMNAAISEVASFTQNPVQVTIQTNPLGRSYYLDGFLFTTPQTRTIQPGESHFLEVFYPQGSTPGKQYVWTSWSDGGAARHSVTIPDSNITYTATFGTQYYLTIAANAGGTAGPASNWQDSGSVVAITASPNTGLGYAFGGWRGKGSGSYTGPNNPASVTMNAPINDTANFTQFPVHFTVTTAPVGRTIFVDGTSFVSPQTFTWISGSNHTVAVPDSQLLGARTRYMFTGWSDAGAKSHTVTPVRDSTVTASFSTQYFLVMNASGGGTVAPASNWYNSGQLVPISATPNSGYSFGGWNGAGNGSYTGPSASASVTMNDSVSETGSFVLIPVHVTIQTNPVGRSFTVDSTTYSTTQVFTWSFGTSHTISTATPQAGTTGVQYVWNNWSDGGAIAHSVTATGDTTIVANFATQFFLTMNTDTGGTVTPANGWFNSGQLVTIAETPNAGFRFGSWAGSGAGSYTGSNSSPTITMNAPITETASFVRFTAQVVVQTIPAGLVIFVDNTQYTSPHTFTWTTGSSHTIAPGDTLSGGTGIQYVWNTWSDGGTKSHAVSPLKDTTFTANYTTRYFLTMTANPGGTVAPASGWFSSGQIVSITAVPASRYSFSSWSGSGNGSYSGYTNPWQVTMNGPITEIANFAQNAVQITIQTNPPGRTYYFDYAPYTATLTRTVYPGEVHNLDVVSPQPGSSGSQYIWKNWSDGGSAAHAVTIPDSNVTYIVTYGTQYYLTMAANTGGTAGPASNWQDSGAAVTITAFPNTANGYAFSGWRGKGSGSYTGPNNPASVTMNAPINDTANFTLFPVHFTVTTAPVGRTITVDGTSFVSPQTFTWITGSNHTVAVPDSQPLGARTRYMFSGWSDAGAKSHTITPVRDSTVTASFSTQYFLVMNASGGGTVAPPSNWYNSGQLVAISATPNSGYSFGGWNGAGSGSYTGPSATASVTMNDSVSETASFVLIPVHVTIQTNPVGRSFTVDSTTYTTTQVFTWSFGTSHTISTATPQAGTTGVQYVWSNWSDGGPIAHSVAATSDSTIIANFAAQYFLTMSTDTSAGTVAPASNWYNGGQLVPISATPKPGFTFGSWAGSGAGSYTGSNSSPTVTMNAPITEAASFVRFTAQVVVQTNPAGLVIFVDNTQYASPHTFTWTTGSSHTIAPGDTLSGGPGIQYVWNNWSDGGLKSHAVSPLKDTTFTANYITRYFLTMTANPGGTVAPANGWFNSGQIVSITAVPASRYSFNSWSGSGTGSYSGYINPSQLTMNGPITEIASFAQNAVQITIQTNPSGRTYYFDGFLFTTPQTRTFQPGEIHYLEVFSPQASSPGKQYVWRDWSDSGTARHPVTIPDSAVTYTATFGTQYYLTMVALTGGSVSPASDWHDAGSVVQISATPDLSYSFLEWRGSGLGAYTGPTDTALVTMRGPITDTARFTQYPVHVTVGSNPPGRTLKVDGSSYTSSQQFTWISGAYHTVSTTVLQGDTLTRYNWLNWSDGGGISHTVSANRDTSFTTNFNTQHFLKVITGSGGTVTPPSDWHDLGQMVTIIAKPNPTYQFGGWNGTGSGSYSGNQDTAIVTVNAPITESASFVLQPISVTLRTNLPGRTFIVDSVRYTSTQTFIWQYGSNHTIGTLTPQAGAPSTRHLFRNWSDGGALSHRITPVMDTVFTANFSTQYFLWMSADSGGTASPPNSWQDSASTVQITGIPHPGYSFSSWNGNGNGSYTGTGNPDSVVMLESLVQTASFSRFGAQVVVQSSPGGLSITVDGVNYPSPQTFTWTTGSAHTVSAADTQSGTAGIRYVWNNWNDGKPRLHAVTPLGDTTFTANFKTQYYLTMTANAGGTVIPPSGWFTNGQNVTLTALPDTRYNFNVWSGTGPASYTGYQNPVTLTIGAPTSEIASFIRKPVQIVIQSVPPGRPFWYDGYTYTDPQTRTVDPGVEHFLGATSPQPITPFVLQYAFKNWSDGGGVFHSIFPDSNTTYTITFKTQYYLTLAAETGGNATPASDWQDSGKVVSIYAVANDGFGFQRWSGIGAGAYAGSRNPATVTMMGPISDTAFFGPGIKATFVSNPAGRKITVDDSTYIAPKSLNWLIGSAHTIKTASPQSDTAGTRYLWKQWSDSGAVTHNIAPTRDTTIAANFRTEYYLAVSAGSGGRVSPPSGWCVKDSSVLLQAFPDSGQGLLEWIGTGPASYSGSSNPVRITMTSWVNEIAHFGRLLPPPTLAGTDGETNQPTSKMLNWHTYPGATLYQLQVATDSLFANIIVDLTTTSDTSFQVNALANLTTYYWHVKARVGNDITTFSGSRRFTTMAATLTAISPVRNWATKFIFPIRWKSTDLSGNVNIKLSTDGGYIYTMIMANVPNSGNASWSVPDSARWISSNCKLRIESVLNTAIFDESFVFSIASGALPATALVSTSISYPDDRAPTTAYRLVGGPGIVDTVRVSSILTGKQKIDWRVFWDNGAADNYLVELSGSSNLITGAGYWVLNKGNLDVSTTMRMPPLAADATFSIPLHAAWNIIANPFDKNVSWISVQDANGLPAAARILSYSGSYDSSGTMQTFGGYYYFNASNATSLKIPYPFGLTQPMRARQAVREDDGWKVRLSYETDINRDADNYIGITPGAKAGYDELETHKPPLFLDQGFLYFPRPDWDASYSRFNTDFRPALGDGQVWEFEVMNPRKSRGVIRLGGIEGIPAENQVILVGEYESTPIDMRKDNSYTFTPAADRMKFRLITGKQTFVEKELGKLAPQAYELAQNFPNPFNSTTAISVKLPEDSKIRLEIYSTLGQRIAELADGLYTRGVHTFRWQGTDEAGRAVATGVYFYRLTYGTNLVQSKKMIIAK